MKPVVNHTPCSILLSDEAITRTSSFWCGRVTHGLLIIRNGGQCCALVRKCRLRIMTDLERTLKGRSIDESGPPRYCNEVIDLMTICVFPSVYVISYTVE